MEETYSTRAIILSRAPFRENDINVLAYTKDRGMIGLVGRGGKRFSSKLAGHLEPITFSRVMVVRGRQFDYAGAVASENCYPGIKSDLEKLAEAGEIIGIFRFKNRNYRREYEKRQ